MKSKEIKLMFRDEQKEDMVGGSIIIYDGMNWLDIEKLLAEFLKKHTGKFDTVAAAIITNEWMQTKKFPDGTHFFVNWENDWGWKHGFLYRVKDPAPLEKVFEGTPPTPEEAPGGYITSACGTKFQRSEALMVLNGAAIGIVLAPDTAGIEVEIKNGASKNAR